MMRGIIFGLGVAVSLAIPASAHHSFDGAFDRNKLITLSGTIIEFKFTEPHVYVRLSVTAADGTAQTWLVETTSAHRLASNGWTPQSIKVGEKLSVQGWPAWEGKNYMRLRTMSQADGSAVNLWLPAYPTPLPAGMTRTPGS